MVAFCGRADRWRAGCEMSAARTQIGGPGDGRGREQRHVVAIEVDGIEWYDCGPAIMRRSRGGFGSCIAAWTHGAPPFVANDVSDLIPRCGAHVAQPDPVRAQLRLDGVPRDTP